jgi:hypothetical protein
VAERLDRDRYMAARRAGSAMTPADLVVYSSIMVKELAGDAGPA